METKVFEVRDNATHIGVIATRMRPSSDAEAYELERNGFKANTNLVILTTMHKPQSEHDPFEWGNRTLFNAHRYIEENFDELNTGDVIDVRYILGETDKPCKSDKYWGIEDETI